MEANREYKASLFSKLFSEPSRLRELYNALANTNYGEDTPIEFNTLENLFFNELRNDLSFTIDDKYVVLLEHQSTINANMPLRCLMYIARVYGKITNDRDTYQEKLCKIPTPEFIVRYNGVKPFPEEKILSLSEAYKATDGSVKHFGSLELTVRVVNINHGYNDKLLQKSEWLNGYAAIVEYIRHLQRKGRSLEDAIKETINWGISQGILSAFLTENKAEVSGMLRTEFNIDIAKEVWQEEAREDGYEEGYEEGLADARKEFQVELTAKNDEIAELKAKLAEQSK